VFNIPENAVISNWHYLPASESKETGAQIDLLFDRDDGVITICEIRHCNKPYKIDKVIAKSLAQKIDVFQKRTNTEKQIFFSVI